MTLMSNAVVTHLVHAVHLYATKDFKRFLTDHSYTLLAFLSVLGALKDTY